MKKKKLSIILLTMLISCSNKVSAEKLKIKDMPNNWSRTHIEYAIENNLLQGSNGYIRPNDNLTRAELATIVNRVLRIDKKANISKFKDVSSDKWYYKEMQKSVASGIFKGNNNKLNPERSITREEAFLVMSRVFELTDEESDLINEYNDGEKVSNWAKSGVNGLIKAGVVEGDKKNNLNPKKNITRAEYAAIINKLISKYIVENSSLDSQIIDGNVVNTLKNLSLKDTKINGDLLLTENVSNGEISFENVNITGRVLIRGNIDLVIKNSKVDSIVNLADSTKINLDKKSNIKNLESRLKVHIEGEGKVDTITLYEGSDKSNILINYEKLNLPKKLKEITIKDEKSELETSTNKNTNKSKSKSRKKGKSREEKQETESVKKEKEKEEAEAAKKEKEKEEAEAAKKEKEKEEAEAAKKEKEKEEAEAAKKEKEKEEAEAAKKEKEKQEAEAVKKEKEKEEAEAAKKEKEKQEAEAAKKEKEKEEAEAAKKEKEKQEAEAAKKEKEKEEAEAAKKEKEKQEAEAAKKEKEKEEAEAAKKEKEKQEAEAAKKEKENQEAEAAKKEKEHIDKSSTIDDIKYNKIISSDLELENMFDITLKNYPSSISFSVSNKYFKSLTDGNKLNTKLGDIFQKVNNKDRLKYTNNQIIMNVSPFYNNDEKINIKVDITYPDLNGGHISGEKLRKYDQEANKKIDSFIEKEILGKNLLDEEKALKINDFIVLGADYNKEGLYKYNIEDHIPYGVLVKGKGVCESYAKAFSLIANKAGLENIYVTGKAYNGMNENGEDHAWNMVKIRGSWYNIDTTWNDIGGDNVRYDYFLKSDKDLINSHHRDNNFPYPRAEGTEDFIKKMNLN